MDRFVLLDSQIEAIEGPKLTLVSLSFYFDPDSIPPLSMYPKSSLTNRGTPRSTCCWTPFLRRNPLTSNLTIRPFEAVQRVFFCSLWNSTCSSQGWGNMGSSQAEHAELSNLGRGFPAWVILGRGVDEASRPKPDKEAAVALIGRACWAAPADLMGHCH